MTANVSFMYTGLRYIWLRTQYVKKIVHVHMYACMIILNLCKLTSRVLNGKARSNLVSYAVYRICIIRFHCCLNLTSTILPRIGKVHVYINVLVMCPDHNVRSYFIMYDVLHRIYVRSILLTGKVRKTMFNIVYAYREYNKYMAL